VTAPHGPPRNGTAPRSGRASANEAGTPTASIAARDAILAETDLAELFRDEVGEPKGQMWPCPAPEHSQTGATPPVSIDGQVWCCHACGAGGSAVDLLVVARGMDVGQALDELRLLAGMEPFKPSREPRAKRVAHYEYMDTEGGALYRQVRLDPKGFFAEHPDPDHPGRWLKGMGDTPRVLYRLPQVIEAVGLSETIYVAEGEKDVEAIVAAGACATCNPMGAGKWSRCDSAPLHGAARVVVVADRDAPGYAHAAEVARSLTGHVGHLGVVQAATGKDAADHLAAGHGLADLEPVDPAVLEPRTCAPEEAIQGMPATAALPSISTEGQLEDLTGQATEALRRANNPPVLFVRGGALARVRADEDDRPIIDVVDANILRHRLARVSHWVSKREKSVVDSPPPLTVVRDLLAAGSWPCPPLKGITEVPLLRPDGTILGDPGYDAGTRLIYAPAAGLVVPPVSEAPGQHEVDQAIAIVEEAIGDFPFASDADRAGATALMLTPVLRSAIRGAVPLALIDAAQRATGKSLFAEVVAEITTGRPAGMLPDVDARGDDEMRKRLTTLLSEGHPIICVDNIEGCLSSPSLAAAITAREWTDRILGRTESVTVPISTTWIATGNNVRVSADLVRRCYRIRLDARVSRPWDRDGPAPGQEWRHPLPEWATEHRGELIWALLTICRSWWAAGCPPAPGLRTLGGFGAWTRIVGGVLAHAGIEGFLAGLDEMHDEIDDETPQWEALLRGWAETLGEEWLSAATVADALADGGSLAELCPDALAGVTAAANPTQARQRLGKALRTRVDRRFGAEQWHLQRGRDARSGAATWRVCRAGPEQTQNPHSPRTPRGFWALPADSGRNHPEGDHQTEEPPRGVDPHSPRADVHNPSTDGVPLRGAGSAGSVVHPGQHASGTTTDHELGSLRRKTTLPATLSRIHFDGTSAFSGGPARELDLDEEHPLDAPPATEAQLPDDCPESSTQRPMFPPTPRPYWEY
jgi:hypothetical protein